MSANQDENENNTERQELEEEITTLLGEINRLKTAMFELYQKNKDKAVFRGYNAASISTDATRTVCVPDRSKKKRKITQKEKMNAQFYRRFVRVFCRSRLDAVRFSFPRFGKESFGLQFRCMAVGKYYLEKCYLPHTFNMQDEKQNTYPVAFDEIPKYVQIVIENLNAFSLRQKQLDDLKNAADKRVLIHHSSCYTDIDLNFKIVTLDANTRKCVNVTLSYPLLHVLPSTVEVTVDGDVLLKRYLEAIFAVFKEETLPKAYQQAFVNSDQLKFFI